MPIRSSRRWWGRKRRTFATGGDRAGWSITGVVRDVASSSSPDRSPPGGTSRGYLGRDEEALGHFRQALQVHAKEFRADSANLFKRLAVAEDRSRICKTLANLGRRSAAEACAGTASFLVATPVEPTHAFPRAFFAAIWSDLAEAYDTLAARRVISVATRRAHRSTARDMHVRSLEIWTDLTARQLVSPAIGRRTVGRRCSRP